MSRSVPLLATVAGTSPTIIYAETLRWWRATFTKACACPALDVRIEQVRPPYLLEPGATRGANPLSCTGVVTVFDDRISSRLECSRCGELLKQIAPQPGKRTDRQPGSGAPPRFEAAKQAGLSRDQTKQALRVASVPQATFEAIARLACMYPTSRPMVSIVRRTDTIILPLAQGPRSSWVLPGESGGGRA